jgi:hypothetical protein
MRIEQVPTTLMLGGTVPVDVEAADEPRQLTFRGSPGYMEMEAAPSDDPDDEPFTPPPLRFEIGTAFGPVDCELDTSDDGLVLLEVTTRFDNPNEEACAAALDAYRDLYELWESMLDSRGMR